MRRITFTAFAYLSIWAPVANAHAEQSRFGRALPAVQHSPSEPTILGLRNFHKVTTNFYRSAQPERETAFRVLAREYSIRTVISLRTVGSDEPITRGLGLTLMRFPIHAWAL